MTLQNLYEVNAAGQLVIDVPNELKEKKIRVILEDASLDRQSKLQLMAKAARDPMYLQDMQDVESDFSAIGLQG